MMRAMTGSLMANVEPFAEHCIAGQHGEAAETKDEKNEIGHGTAPYVCSAPSSANTNKESMRNAAAQYKASIKK